MRLQLVSYVKYFWACPFSHFVLLASDQQVCVRKGSGYPVLRVRSGTTWLTNSSASTASGKRRWVSQHEVLLPLVAYFLSLTQHIRNSILNSETIKNLVYKIIQWKILCSTSLCHSFYWVPLLHSKWPTSIGCGPTNRRFRCFYWPLRQSVLVYFSQRKTNVKVCSLNTWLKNLPFLFLRDYWLAICASVRDRKDARHEKCFCGAAHNGLPPKR